MFKNLKLRKESKEQIEKARFDLLNRMTEEDLTKEEWEDLSKRVKAYDEMLKPTFRVSPDTLATIGANILGILIVLNFEKIDIVRSKAFSMILKGR